MTPAEEVVAFAKSWVGREFNPGVTAQCAVFVRKVFQQAGINLPVSSKPADWEQTQGYPQGSAFANSLSGDEQGVYRSFNQLEAGDVVMFRNTYGTFPHGTITHVGICVGAGQMIHRPTSSRPVEQVSLSAWRELFADGRRPKFYSEDRTDIAAKVFVHPDGASLIVSETLGPGTYPINGLEMVFKLGKKA